MGEEFIAFECHNPTCRLGGIIIYASGCGNVHFERLHAKVVLKLNYEQDQRSLLHWGRIGGIAPCFQPKRRYGPKRAILSEIITDNQGDI